MSKRTQNNIGETNKTSVKVHHNPGGKSNWSLGWGGEQQKKPIQKYHNESSWQLGGQKQETEQEKKKRLEEEKRKQQEEAKKKQEANSKLPSFNPQDAKKTNLHFGDEKPDYRRKDEVNANVHTSVKVHNPPGGRSNIQFG